METTNNNCQGCTGNCHPEPPQMTLPEAAFITLRLAHTVSYIAAVAKVFKHWNRTRRVHVPAATWAVYRSMIVLANPRPLREGK